MFVRTCLAGMLCQFHVEGLDEVAETEEDLCLRGSHFGYGEVFWQVADFVEVAEFLFEGRST